MTEQCCECGGRGFTTTVVERPPWVATENIPCDWCDGSGEIKEEDDDE